VQAQVYEYGKQVEPKTHGNGGGHNRNSGAASVEFWNICFCPSLKSQPRPCMSAKYAKRKKGQNGKA
jgi:hypothetical protein